MNRTTVYSISASAVLLALLSLLGTPVTAMTAEEIEAAITEGQRSSGEKETPAAITIGRNKPAGQYMLEIFVDDFSRKADYIYTATTCELWVPWMAYEAESNSAVLDRDYVNEWCLDKDLVAIGVVQAGTGRAAFTVATGRIPLKNAPVTGLELIVDGRNVPPANDQHFDDYGEGNALLYFERSVLDNAKEVVISATIKDKPVRVRFKKKKLDLIR